MKFIYITFLFTSLFLQSCNSIQEHNASWHWERVKEYRKFVNGEITKEQFHGYKYYTGTPDILPSLHYLSKYSKLNKLDLVFPNVPKSREVTLYWMTFCNKYPEIVEATSNPSYSNFETEGVQPFVKR